MKTIALVLVALGAAVAPLAGQLPRNCGDAAGAEASRGDILRYFTDDYYASVREGKWDQLPQSVPTSVVTRRPDCNRIVDAVNARFTQIYPPGSEFRTLGIRHFMYEIGPYYVVVFHPVPANGAPVLGFQPMWIYRKSDLTFLWDQLV